MSVLTDTVQGKARDILDKGLADVFIGYTKTKNGQAVPAFVTDAAKVSTLIYDEFCYVNLTNYLLKPEVRALGKPAIVTKGCDNRSLMILLQEGRIKREDVYILGLDCPGMDKSVCAFCPETAALEYDDFVDNGAKVENPPAPAPPSAGMSTEEKWNYWLGEFEKCIRCYACREVCPTCYCPQCIVERNRPQGIDASPTPRGNLNWHLMRAMHHAGRCAECGECERACPMDIPLMEFMSTMHELVRDKLAADVPGRPGESPSPLSRYRADDKEDFFR